MMISAGQLTHSLGRMYTVGGCSHDSSKSAVWRVPQFPHITSKNSIGGSAYPIIVRQCISWMVCGKSSPTRIARGASTIGCPQHNGVAIYHLSFLMKILPRHQHRLRCLNSPSLLCF